MHKWLKYSLVITGLVVGLIFSSIVFDIINARIFNKSPIISRYEYLGEQGYVDRGVLFDVYYCHYSADVMYVEWEMKFSNYTCPSIDYEPMISMIGNVFIKTYTIENIETTDNENYQSLTVSRFNGEEEEKVTIYALLQSVQIGKKYEIIFRIKSNKIKDNTKSIFENTEIISIVETDKDINQFIR